MLSLRNIALLTALLAASRIEASPGEFLEAEALGMAPAEFSLFAENWGPIDCGVHGDQVSICSSDEGREANLAFARQVRRVVGGLDLDDNVDQRAMFFQEHWEVLGTGDLIWDCQGDLDCEISTLVEATAAWAVLGDDPAASRVLRAREPSRDMPVRPAAKPLRFERGKLFAKIEQDIRARSDAAQTIYKAPAFWYQFENPGLMKRVFEGNGVFGLPESSLLAGELSLDRPEFALLVERWAISFDRHCGEHIPSGALEWVRTYPNREVREISVHPDFEDAVQAFIDHANSPDGRTMAKSGEISQALDYFERIQRGDNMFGTAIEMSSQSLSPVTDVDMLVRDHGCLTPITLQFQENLSRIARGESTLQEAGIGIEGFQEVSDPAPRN